MNQFETKTSRMDYPVNAPPIERGMHAVLQETSERLAMCVERLGSIHNQMSGSGSSPARDAGAKPPMIPLLQLPGVLSEFVNVLEKQIAELQMRMFT